MADDDSYLELDALYRELGPNLVRYLRRLLRHSGLAEDIAQDAFLIMWRRWPYIRNHENLRGYLYKVATRLAWDMVKERTRVLLREETLDHTGREREGSSRGYDERLAVREAVEKLPLRQRQAVWLFYFCGFQQDEIAEIMQIKRDTVGALLVQAHCRLSELLG